MDPNFKIAPIALFAYNRPWHLKSTVESIKRNDLAQNTDLFIYSDGPKNDIDEKNVKEVREYIKSIDGFKSIQITTQNNNVGLANSIISGVTEVINIFNKVIVVEDDMIVSPFFLDYMNNALKIYANESRVMHIAAYMHPIKSAGLPDTFFYRLSSCWGWGTWNRAWKYFNRDIEILKSKFNRKLINAFNVDGHYNYWKQIQDLQTGIIDSWAIRWYASIFLNNGLCLHPSRSLVSNIGLDGTGVHCGESDIYKTQIRTVRINYFENNFEENKLAIERIKIFLKKTKSPIHKRIIRKLSKILNETAYYKYSR